MKVRLLIWAVTLLMVVGAVLVLARQDRAAGPTESEYSRDDLFEFAARMDERLVAFERRLAEVRDSLPATPAADSARLTAESELVECRVMLDSVRSVPDLEEGIRLRDRLELEYAGAKDWLRRLDELAGRVVEEGGGD